MYLYKITIIAKPNLFSSDCEIREIYAELYHPEQLTYIRAKEFTLNVLDNELKGLTVIISVDYTFEYQPELVVNRRN